MAASFINTFDIFINAIWNQFSLWKLWRRIKRVRTPESTAVTLRPIDSVRVELCSVYWSRCVIKPLWSRVYMCVFVISHGWRGSQVKQQRADGTASGVSVPVRTPQTPVCSTTPVQLQDHMWNCWITVPLQEWQTADLLRPWKVPDFKGIGHQKLKLFLRMKKHFWLYDIIYESQKLYYI